MSSNLPAVGGASATSLRLADFAALLAAFSADTAAFSLPAVFRLPDTSPLPEDYLSLNHTQTSSTTFCSRRPVYSKDDLHTLWVVLCFDANTEVDDPFFLYAFRALKAK